ncbi:hypothetical protein QJR26_04270 [Clostridium baratii]
MEIRKSNYTEEEREKIFFMFVNGYTAREIGDSIGRTKEAIQKEIQKIKKDLKNLKRVEKRAENTRKDREKAIRALNHEVNSFIGAKALIKKNRTHYRYTKEGNLALKKKEYEYTNDMPKRAWW